MNKHIRINGKLYEEVVPMNESVNEDFFEYMKKVLSKVSTVTSDVEEVNYDINSSLAPEFDDLDKVTEDKYYSILSRFSDVNSELRAIRNSIKELIK